MIEIADVIARLRQRAAEEKAMGDAIMTRSWDDERDASANCYYAVADALEEIADEFAE